MKIWVTGGAGFIGSHVTAHLVTMGHEVQVLDNLSSGRIENVPREAGFICGDIRDREWHGAVADFAPEVLIHLAAQVSVPRSVEDPEGDARTNIVGSLNVLEFAGRHGLRKVIYSSSAAVYGVPDRLPLSERQVAKPICPYGVSKYAVEQYLPFFRDRFGLDYVVLRFANVYGPRQDPNGEGGVVSVFAKRLAAGKAPMISGDGSQTRDFVYVGDVAEAVALSIECGESEIINVATATRMSVLQLSRIMSASFGYRDEPLFMPERAGDIPHSCLENTRASEVLGWQPRTRLEDGLDAVRDWIWESGLVEAESSVDGDGPGSEGAEKPA